MVEKGIACNALIGYVLITLGTASKKKYLGLMLAISIKIILIV